MPEVITNVNTAEQYKKDYKLYALYVCRHRVSIDSRDGLKPVVRKILYSTFTMGDKTRYPNVKKSATIVGDVMGTYHPHGDASTYSSIKPLVNDFEINIPLMNKNGSWGDKFGTDSAAMRYTETGLSQFSQDYLFKDLSETRDSIDWLKNFDETTLEPEYLPAALPLALINGTFGVAVGFKIEIPKHNINEVIDTTINLIRNPNSRVVLIPEHCMACEIVDTDWESICNLGIGSYTVRGIMETSTFNDKPAIIIKSAPDLVYYDSIKDKIEKLINDKKIINITDIDQHGDKLIISLKPGSDTNYIKQLIYQYTDMECTCRVNFEVLDNMIPLRMSYKSYLLQWLEFRRFTKFRVYCNRLQNISTRIHNIEPYVKMAQHAGIEEIINLVRSNNMSEPDLVELLISKYNFTDIQAKFILNLKVKSLSKLALEKYIVEYNDLIQRKQFTTKMITDENCINEEIINELEAAKKKYGKKRHTRVISKSEAGGIPSGEFKLIFTENNFIKKLPLNESIPPLKNDAVKFILKGDNAENIIIFNEMGKVFKFPIHKIPFSDRRSNGVDIRLLLKNCTSNINAVIYEPTLKGFIDKMRKYYIVTLSRNGYIKKMDLDDFISANNSGLVYAKLDEDDYIKDVMIIRSDSDVVVYSTNKAVRFSMESVPYLKRATKGNKTLSTVVDGLSIIKNDTTDIIVVTKKGYINRFDPLGLSKSDRTSRASKVIKLTKGDEILSVLGLNNKDVLIVNSTSGKTNISINDIPTGSSISPGTKMIPNKGDTIISCKFIRNK